jgi:glycosyltransferase involved in cell wall biosynthesis/LmbE family N-acetylglucosaminyl deacetylase/SAM-dependent methyltransferase
MNICFASLSYPRRGETSSGVGTQIEILAQALLKAGHSVTVIDDAGSGPTSENEDRGVRVHRMRSGKLHWYASKLPLVGNALALPLREIEFSIAVWRGVRSAQRAGSFDLVEGTETGMLCLAWFLKNIPLVIRLHGEQFTFLRHTPGARISLGLRLTRALQRIALRRAKLLISPSKAHAREIEEELGSSHPPIVVVPNALAAGGYEYDSAIKRTSNTVLYAGRIEERKGIQVLLEAAAQAKQQLPGTRFVIAGGFHSSFSAARFASVVDNLGLQDSVELLGSIDTKDLARWYQRATICVLPSYYETFGLAALEPMLFGTPVVATSASALPEVVSEETGLLVPAGDAGALANAIVDLLQDDAKRQRLGEACTKRAAAFGIDRLLSVNERLYRWSATSDEAQPGPHVFLSPHADDAVLSCGGLIDSLLSRRLPVEVINIFAGASETPDYSAFARHLHAKWGLTEAPLESRWSEDTSAMEKLGVTRFQRWNYSEAPYRKTPDDEPLYAAYEEMMGPVVVGDQDLGTGITERLRRHLDQLPETTVVYCPLSLGNHVDHQLLFGVGLRLAESGKQLRFYEDYPYARQYKTNGHLANWLPRTVPINLERKLDAANAYTSQVRGMGGSAKVLSERLTTFGNAGANDQPAERYWELIDADTQPAAEQATVSRPLVPVATKPRLRDFKKFLTTFKWHDVSDTLPVGQGWCLDVGCGPAPHRKLIEERGYRWIGLDASKTDQTLQASAVALPLADESLSALVASQVLEYVEEPKLVFAEAARVLEPGGAFCGSVSFLEPVHGRTYFNFSPLILEQLLRRHGFADVQIKPGLNGFALMAWTGLRRSGIPSAEALAIPLAFLLIAPFAGIIFLLSWLSLLMGFGSGHGMRWLSERAPLDFAGHLIFVARKKARATK